MMENKVCVKINCYKGFSYQETFDGIKNAGFKYVELSTSKGNSSGISFDSSLNQLTQIKEDLSKRGIIPIAIGGNSYIMDDDTNKLLTNIYLAHFFNCQYVDTTMFNARNDAQALASVNQIVEKIKFYIPYLEQYNLDLVIELHGQYSTGSILTNILNKVNSKHVHINYDTGNALFWGKLEVDEMVNDFKDNIKNISFMHLKDKLDEKQVWNFPALGKGYIPFKDIFKILQDNNNTSTLSVEIEFTEKGVNDVNEVNQALIDSANYLKSLGLNLN